MDLIKSGKVRPRSTSLKHASKLEIRDLCSALAKGVKREREGLCSSVKRERQRKRRKGGKKIEKEENS